MNDLIGISTNVMTGVDIWEVARLTREYGLTCLEIHLGDFEAAVGNPWMIPYAGVWPRTFSQSQREKLRVALSHIRNLLVHGTPVDVNIAALNPGIRAESERQYLEAIELAADLGASWVTFHVGSTSLAVVPPAEVRRHNVEFMRKALESSQESGIRLAYESFDADLLEQIPDRRFGLLLDTGHAVMAPNRFCPDGRGDTRTIVDWIDFLGPRLVELHIHDVINWAENPGRGTAHRSFEYGLCLDLETIVAKLKQAQLAVPLISEMYEPTARMAVETAVRTKERIVRFWGQGQASLR